MKRLVFAIVGTAALALGGCNNNNQDAVQNAELNQPESDLNEIANQAAMDAANAQAAAQANIAERAAGAERCRRQCGQPAGSRRAKRQRHVSGAAGER